MIPLSGSVAAMGRMADISLAPSCSPVICVATGWFTVQLPYRVCCYGDSPVTTAASQGASGRRRTPLRGIHGAPIEQAQPAAPDAIDQPERQRDQDRHTHHCANNRDDQSPADE